MDLEVGEYNYRSLMQHGYFCRPMSEHVTKVELTLRPSAFKGPLTGHVPNGEPTLQARMVAAPYALRSQYIKENSRTDPRPHAVCTVQTFRNNQTGDAKTNCCHVRFIVQSIFQAQCCTFIPHTIWLWAGGNA
jgi:hypothetical protein